MSNKFLNDKKKCDKCKVNPTTFFSGDYPPALSIRDSENGALQTQRAVLKRFQIH